MAIPELDLLAELELCAPEELQALALKVSPTIKMTQ
jgi:hypothetical protein